MFLTRRLSPSRIFVLSFALFILAGTLALYLPASSTKVQLRFIDALFTATSAVCVTGLAVIDIGKDLSLFGQIVTIVLFQVGGLGIITFSVFLFGIMGRGMSFKGREIVQSTFLPTPTTDFFHILKSVLYFTGAIEGIGILLLFIRFLRDFPPAAALYRAVYTGISAFNNCGYSLFSDSLMGYQGDLLVNLTVMGLIVSGGLGFIVHHEIFDHLWDRRNMISIHSKIVLITTAILILGGAALFFLFESRHIMRDMPFSTKILVSFFQSITPRTAGFNTVDIGLLTNDTILLMIILMFIGASPGSTGGGVKTTSAALLALLLFTRFKGTEQVNVFNRTIPPETITRTIFIIFASAFSISIITSFLLFAAPSGVTPGDTRHFFVEYLFETVSAFGTVGLSMGVTPRLTDVQKYAITLMMFAGRVGPLTLAFSLASQARRKGITYAEETVSVG